MDTVEYIARENTDANENLVAAVHLVVVSIRRRPSSSFFNLVVFTSSASIHRHSSSSCCCYRPLCFCRRRQIKIRSIRIEMIGEASIQQHHEVLSVVLLPLKSAMIFFVVVLISRSIFEWY